jgi:uncharacterized RDD family membrane protein YckC
MSTTATPADCCAGCQATFPSNMLVTLKGRQYCATCKDNTLDDLKAGVSTDGVEMATLGSRFAAQFIDGIIIIIPVMILAGLAGFFQAASGQSPGFSSNIVQQAVFSLPFLLYAGLMLSAKNGQTIGKKYLKIRVVQPNGEMGTPAHFWKREALRWVMSLIPLVGLIDYVMAFNKNRRSLHDKIGGTIVVRVG